jgi:hypothetical protein
MSNQYFMNEDRIENYYEIESSIESDGSIKFYYLIKPGLGLKYINLALIKNRNVFFQDIGVLDNV